MDLIAARRQLAEMGKAAIEVGRRTSPRHRRLNIYCHTERTARLKKSNAAPFCEPPSASSHDGGAARWQHEGGAGWWQARSAETRPRGSVSGRDALSLSTGRSIRAWRTLCGRQRAGAIRGFAQSNCVRSPGCAPECKGSPNDQRAHSYTIPPAVIPAGRGGKAAGVSRCSAA
jgi:hypothetical protein